MNTILRSALVVVALLVGLAISSLAESAQTCPTCDGQTIIVNQNVVANLDPAVPTCTGDPDLCAFFSFDKSGATPDTWKAIFDVGPKKILVKTGVTITVVNVPNFGNNRVAPGIEIRSTCELEIEEGGAIKNSPINQRGGEIFIKIDGNIKINGTVSSIVSGTGGLPGEITIASCCGDITTGPKSLIQTAGADPGGNDIHLLTCCPGQGGDIEIKGLVSATYKGGRAARIDIVSFDGTVTIDGNNVLGFGPGGAPITSGVRVQSTNDPVPGRINIQAKGNVTVLGNRILVTNPALVNRGAVAIKTGSNSSVGGVIDVRSLTGDIIASDRAFDNGNRFNTAGAINLLAASDILLRVTAATNAGALTNAKAVVDNRGGSAGRGGTNTLRAFSGGIFIGDATDPGKVQALATATLPGTNLLTSCSGVVNNGVVNPADGNSGDDMGVCAPPAPAPLFLDCKEFGVDCDCP